jgi:hypothetical protein
LTDQSGQSNGAAIPDLEPGSLTWRITVARWAHTFFNPIGDRSAIAELIGKPYKPDTFEAWSVGDFNTYLTKSGVKGGSATLVALVLDAMQRAALLLPAGWDQRMIGYPQVGQLYVSQGGPSPRAYKGNLWLSEVIGAELIIESYNAVTVLISGGGDDKPVGTGLVLDPTHVVTNRHVIEGLIGPGLGTDLQVHASFTPPGAQPKTRQSRIILHGQIDVAVIETELADSEQLLALPGMTFRDPKWHDEVCVFGYPYVPGLTERTIIVEHGRVVKPSAEGAAMFGYPRQKTVLTSAIARPGNSGGPIVAQDGRVIGLVVENSRHGLSGRAAGASTPEPEQEQANSGSTADADSPPFYRGIPASEVVRAIEELHFSDLVVLENPV